MTTFEQMQMMAELDAAREEAPAEGLVCACGQVTDRPTCRDCETVNLLADPAFQAWALSLEEAAPVAAA